MRDIRRLLFLVTAAMFSVTAVTACSDVTATGTTGDDGNTGGGSTTGTGTGGGGSTGTGTEGTADKIDLVISIDNSRSMADKQAILALAVADLVQSLVNPPCVEPGGAPAETQPATGEAACPAGSERDYPPTKDVHIGVLSSSLGAHGADACGTTETSTCGGKPNVSNNDAGHLLSRQDACGTAVVATYDDSGFLAWDPGKKLSPPGETSAPALSSKLEAIVLGVGQVGCGYESQLESWYRFLVDPEPYQTIQMENGAAKLKGVDQFLLAQRAELLRPDSLLAVLMLSDEDDCSIREGGQFYFAAQQRDPANPNKAFRLPRPRQECAVDPNDPCCKSCAQDQGECPIDPLCMAAPFLDTIDDSVNLRCWDQKRRFGVDFLYPIERYVDALTSKTVPNRAGDLVDNPIFASPGATTPRDPGLVVLAGIVGLPWQDIARDPADLTKGFKSGKELSQSVGGVTGWDVILGDPALGVAPKDPLMIASIDPRSGTNPITGDAVAPPGSQGDNAINGSEYSIPQRDDLQYACIFPLLMPRDCSNPTVISCDCQDQNNDNPLCELDPMTNARTLQVRAKAYPGQRHLGVLEGLGDQGVVASICPSQATDAAREDYAYRPAVRALVESIKARLR